MRAVLLTVALGLVAGFVHADDKPDLDKAAKALAAKDTKTRLKAAQQLATAGEPASRLLCDAMMDKDITVAKAALASLEKANPKLHEPLYRLAIHEDAANQFRALKVLAEIGEGAKPAYRLLETRMRSTATGRDDKWSNVDRSALVKNYFVVLQKCGDERDVINLHKSIAEKPISPLRSKDSFDWLVKWAGDDQDRRREVLPLIKADVTSGTPSVEYIKLAGEYGELSKELVPALKKLDFHKSDAVRTAALDAVKRIEGK